LSTLRDELDLCPTLKWPNDVLLNQKKCAGILVETSLVGDQLVYAILGIGLNVNFSMRAEAPELSSRATTLADELHRPVDIDALERALLEKIDLYYARLLLGTLLLVEWRKHLSTLEQAIRVATSSGVEEGIAEDVAADGALLLRRRDGQLLRLYAGDVTLVPKDGSA
jgi:BirA family biotin operon repressor/biotin-[acetyl-CoA-carboxylase] ligase